MKNVLIAFLAAYALSTSGCRKKQTDKQLGVRGFWPLYVAQNNVASGIATDSMAVFISGATDETVQLQFFDRTGSYSGSSVTYRLDTIIESERVARYTTDNPWHTFSFFYEKDSLHFYLVSASKYGSPTTHLWSY